MVLAMGPLQLSVTWQSQAPTPQQSTPVESPTERALRVAQRCREVDAERARWMDRIRTGF